MLNSLSNIKTVKASEKPKGKEEKTPVEQKEVKDGKKKIALAMGALALAGAVGIAIISNKRAIKLPSRGKELTVEEFKKVGKFDKGIASINGEKFTGILKSKNGFTLSYDMGELCASKRDNIIKTYERSNNGKITTVKIEKILEDGRRMLVKETKRDKINNTLLTNLIGQPIKNGYQTVSRDMSFSPDGRIISDKTFFNIEKTLPHSTNDKSVSYLKTIDNLTGEKTIGEKHFRSASDKISSHLSKHNGYKKHNVTLPNGKKGLQVYDERGKLLYNQYSIFHPNTRSRLDIRTNPDKNYISLSTVGNHPSSQFHLTNEDGKQMISQVNLFGRWSGAEEPLGTLEEALKRGNCLSLSEFVDEIKSIK